MRNPIGAEESSLRVTWRIQKAACNEQTKFKYVWDGMREKAVGVKKEEIEVKSAGSTEAVTQADLVAWQWRKTRLLSLLIRFQRHSPFTPISADLLHVSTLVDHRTISAQQCHTEWCNILVAAMSKDSRYCRTCHYLLLDLVPGLLLESHPPMEDFVEVSMDIETGSNRSNTRSRLT
jgi:hypothetical protein